MSTILNEDSVWDYPDKLIAKNLLEITDNQERDPRKSICFALFKNILMRNDIIEKTSRCWGKSWYKNFEFIDGCSTKSY